MESKETLQETELSVRMLKEKALHEISVVEDMINERKFWKYRKYLDSFYPGIDTEFKAMHPDGISQRFNRKLRYSIKMEFEVTETHKRLKKLYISVTELGVYSAVAQIYRKTETKDGKPLIEDHWEIRRWKHTEYWLNAFLQWINGFKSQVDKYKLKKYKDRVGGALYKLL